MRSEWLRASDRRRRPSRRGGCSGRWCRWCHRRPALGTSTDRRPTSPCSSDCPSPSGNWSLATGSCRPRSAACARLAPCRGCSPPARRHPPAFRSSDTGPPGFVSAPQPARPAITKTTAIFVTLVIAVSFLVASVADRSKRHDVVGTVRGGQRLRATNLFVFCAEFCARRQRSLADNSVDDPSTAAIARRKTFLESGQRRAAHREATAASARMIAGLPRRPAPSWRS